MDHERVRRGERDLGKNSTVMLLASPCLIALEIKNNLTIK